MWWYELLAAACIFCGGTFSPGTTTAGGKWGLWSLPWRPSHGAVRKFGRSSSLCISENKFHLKTKCFFSVQAVYYYTVLLLVCWSRSIWQLAKAGFRAQRVHAGICAFSLSRCHSFFPCVFSFHCVYLFFFFLKHYQFFLNPFITLSAWASWHQWRTSVAKWMERKWMNQ